MRGLIFSRISVLLLTTSLAIQVARAAPPYARFDDPQVYCTISGTPCNAVGCTDNHETNCDWECEHSEPMFFDVADVLVPDEGPFESLDEWPEVAVANQANDPNPQSPSQIAFFRNLGTSSDILELSALYDVDMEAGKVYDIEFAEMDSVTADLPSFLDLVVTVQHSTTGEADEIVILYNNGYGDYSIRPQHVVQLEIEFANGLKTGDFDGDGHVDIAVAGARTHFGNGFARDPVMEVLLAKSGEPDGFLHSGIIRVDTDVDPNQAIEGQGSDLVTPILCPPQVSGRRDLIMSVMNRHSNAPDNQVIVLFENTGTDAAGNILWDQTNLAAKNSVTLAFGKLQTGQDKRDVAIANDAEHSFWIMKQTNSGSCPFYASPDDAAVSPAFSPIGVDIAKVDITDTKQDLVVACADATGEGDGGAF